ncbi:uncharacterized protein LOC116237279 isoform X2 [Phasianus colchicus]|uniref:uncharacterized protein LOC116237279 isoform X2 n=1 Tax=Phasianus colchicus TaxID=9054 RepID=UPI00129D3623|nr:uncharacterized protein LOC116237279 isoform X2 [Phasianus colchicus]
MVIHGSFFCFLNSYPSIKTRFNALWIMRLSKGFILVAPDLSQPSAAGWGCAQCVGTRASPPPPPFVHCSTTAPEMPPGIILGHESPRDVADTFVLTGSRWQALALKGEGQGDNNITQHSDILEATGAPITTTWDVSGLTTGPVGSPSPSDTGNLTTITVPLQAGAPGNQTRNESGFPIRYWSPIIFVVLALLVLFFTYRRTKGNGSQEPTTSISDFSDEATPENDTALIVTAAQKRSDNPPPQELSKTTPCQPAPPSEQPSQPTDPTTVGSSLCSGVPVDD